MIYANEQSDDRSQFENLLQQIKIQTLSKLADFDQPSSLSGSEFELLVFDTAVECAHDTQFEGTLTHTADREFPDIVAAGYFGIEVKATKKDDWTSVGNSVLESSRIKYVEKIYMFFGKLGGTPDIIYRDYADCLKAIAVTHWPRYQIDMKLKNGESIFNKMNLEYDVMRTANNPIKEIRAYYKRQLNEGESLWWIDDDLDATATGSPIIKNLGALNANEKDAIRADIFVHFPEVFSTSTRKFERIPAYLVSSHSVLSNSLRDFFTAGGQVEVRANGKMVRVPKIFGEAARLKDKISEILNEKSQEELANAWLSQIENFKTPKIAWLAEVEKQASSQSLPCRISDLFSEKN